MEKEMTIERTQPLIIGGSLITGFVRHNAKSLADAQTCLPDLTREQYKAIRAGKAHIEGDTKDGLNYVERA